MSTTLTGVQRLETRRTLLQSVAEMSRGLKVISGFLKMGKFGMARDQIAAVDAMLQLHEMLAQELNRDNRRLAAHVERLEALVLDIDSALAERSVTLGGTADRMLEQGALPKDQREDDYDHEVTMRYSAYAAQARSIMMMVRNKIAGQS
jgi:hypothetical protein